MHIMQEARGVVERCSTISMQSILFHSCAVVSCTPLAPPPSWLTQSGSHAGGAGCRRAVEHDQHAFHLAPLLRVAFHLVRAVRRVLFAIV